MRKLAKLLLRVDLECVAVAEPCHEISIVNDETWCLQFATVEQTALFCRNCYEHHVKTFERDECSKQDTIIDFELGRLLLM